VEGGDKRLIAWFACHPGEAMPEIEDLRALLQRSLPGYMQPSAIVPLPALPRMPNGKVDTRSLAATALEAGLGGREIVAPRTAREKRLAQIWAEALHLDEVGVTTSIFELGGDSLVIFRSTMMAKKAGFQFTPRDVFQYRTIAALSSLDEQTVAEPSKAAPPVAAPVITRAARDARRASRLSL
jgi:hypothetical protein